jgi:glycosyltransferase involved in cell wall biosynthesis
MRVQVVDPSAFTPPYDHALCAALARRKLDVELITSRFAYGSVPPPDGYARRELFYGRAPASPDSRLRTSGKLLEHVPDMLRYRRLARAADVVHFQWLPVQWLDRHLLPRRPLVLTAHDLLPREPRPGQVRGQRRLYDAVDAVIVHSEHGRRELVDVLALPASKVHVVPHGAFEHLTRIPEVPLPEELSRVEVPVALFFGLLRPYKGIEVLLEAWAGIDDAELWIVGRPRMPLDRLRALAPRGVRFIPRYVSDAELGSFFRRARVVVLPYTRTDRFDQSGVLATGLAFGKAILVSDVGGFGEVAALGAVRAVPAEDALALADAIRELLTDRRQRERLERGARETAAGPLSWAEAAARTVAVYEQSLLQPTQRIQLE